MWFGDGCQRRAVTYVSTTCGSGWLNSATREPPVKIARLACPLNAKLTVMNWLHRNSRLLILGICSLLLIACGAEEEPIEPNAVQSVSAKPAARVEHFPQLEQIDNFFVRENYEMQRLKNRAPAPTWMIERFNAVGITEMDYRRVHQVPDMDDNTFYRFMLIIESFWTPAQAEQRLARLDERPPQHPNSEPDKAFPLRRGFAVGSLVYILATDVNAFTPELDRLTKELEPHIRENVRIDP